FIAWGMQNSGTFGSQAFGLSGLLMAPVISAGKWGWYLGGWLISVIMGAVLTYLFGFKDSMAERIMD
ncbi:PTS tagatose transporter subunit IIABC, partial [Clostridioides difficile]|nr:PTS tagatose transporter subunit IIABC [Clostridioides difficile]